MIRWSQLKADIDAARGRALLTGDNEFWRLG